MVAERQGAELDASVGRILGADRKQLALDVLVNSMDLLAAAAIGQLRRTLPKVAEELAAPLESSAPRSAGSADEDPAGGVADPGNGAATASTGSSATAPSK